MKRIAVLEEVDVNDLLSIGKITKRVSLGRVLKDKFSETEDIVICISSKETGEVIKKIVVNLSTRDKYYITKLDSIVFAINDPYVRVTGECKINRFETVSWLLVSKAEFEYNSVSMEEDKFYPKRMFEDFSKLVGIDIPELTKLIADYKDAKTVKEDKKEEEVNEEELMNLNNYEIPIYKIFNKVFAKNSCHVKNEFTFSQAMNVIKAIVHSANASKVRCEAGNLVADFATEEDCTNETVTNLILKIKELLDKRGYAIVIINGIFVKLTVDGEPSKDKGNMVCTVEFQPTSNDYDYKRLMQRYIELKLASIHNSL